MKVFWTDRARRRLQEIHSYIAQDSPRAASQIVVKLVARSQRLAEQALPGRTVPEYHRRDIREVLERPFRIIYIVLPDRQRIDVLTVMHYRQRLPTAASDL